MRAGELVWDFLKLGAVRFVLDGESDGSGVNHSCLHIFEAGKKYNLTKACEEKKYEKTFFKRLL